MKLLLFFLFCHISSPVKHSMKVFFTASSGVPNFPEVVVVVLINDAQTGYCDSNIKTALPKQDWMENLINGDPTYWKWYTQECTVHQQLFRDELHNLKKHLNQTGSVHILQRLSSCEWDEETGDINGFHQYGYNGEDFLVFHLETQTWITPKPQSVIIKHMWDRDGARNDFLKNFMNRICLDCLLKNLEYGKKSLLRTDLPSVSLLQKTPSSPVSCHATGFYPDRAMIFWRKDGEELHEDVDLGEILPNHDGSFQRSVDLKPPGASEDWTKYKCVFQLSGMKDDVVTRLDKAAIRTNEENPIYMIIIIVVAVVVLAFVLIAAIGFMVYKKKNVSAENPPHDRGGEDLGPYISSTGSVNSDTPLMRVSAENPPHDRGGEDLGSDISSTGSVNSDTPLMRGPVKSPPRDMKTEGLRSDTPPTGTLRSETPLISSSTEESHTLLISIPNTSAVYVPNI